MTLCDFPGELHNRLWHTTRRDRFQRILETGSILSEPDLPDTDRWHTACGQANFPYVRWIGGISLFDFDAFDPNTYEMQYPLSSWRTFVPFRRDWGESIWIEIDRISIGANFICGKDLLLRRRQEKALGHDIMPMIEAACLKDIPTSAFRMILIGNSKSANLYEFT